MVPESCDAAVHGARVLLDIPGEALRADLRRRLEDLGALVTDAASDPDSPADLLVCERIPDVCPAPVMVLCAADDPADRVAALRAGADEAVSLPVAAPVVIARIGAVLRRIRHTGGGPPAPGVMEAGRIRLDPSTGIAHVGDHAARLTPRETALLALLMREPGHVVSHGRILAEVWGGRHHDDVNLVATYVRYLRRKLDTGGGPSVIRTARGFGYAVQHP